MSPAADVPLVLVAHGSPDPRHREDVEFLAGAVRQGASSRTVAVAYLEHHGPTPAEVGAGLPRGGAEAQAVVVPVLLTRAYHVRVDMPGAARAVEEASGRRVTLAEALGPHPLVAQAIAELIDLHLAPATTPGVVVYLAGSSEADAVTELVACIEAYPPPGGTRGWRCATLDGRTPLDVAIASLGPGEVVAVSAMIAEGILRDRMVQRCADRGVAFIPGVLGRTRALAELVLVRAGESQPWRRG